jgi:hypothetical protein
VGTKRRLCLVAEQQVYRSLRNYTKKVAVIFFKANPLSYSLVGEFQLFPALVQLFLLAHEAPSLTSPISVLLSPT